MCDSCNWEELLKNLDRALRDDLYSFASKTLCGIEEWVKNAQHCTDKQRQAVCNIINNTLKHQADKSYGGSLHADDGEDHYAGANDDIMQDVFGDIF